MTRREELLLQRARAAKDELVAEMERQTAEVGLRALIS